MIKEERNLTDEKMQQVTTLEMEVEELKKLLKEKTLQASKLELKVKEKDEELTVAQRVWKKIVKKKDEEILHLTKEQVKRELEDEI